MAEDNLHWGANVFACEAREKFCLVIKFMMGVAKYCAIMRAGGVNY